MVFDVNILINLQYLNSLSIHKLPKTISDSEKSTIHSSYID